MKAMEEISMEELMQEVWNSWDLLTQEEQELIANIIAGVEADASQVQ